MESTDDARPTDLKACMNFKWTDELTMQFILYRHERRQAFTKKRNTSRHGWQQILRDMGLSAYVTPYQAQKKWNNLWSKYKVAKRAQAEGVTEDDPNGVWPFFTVLDAIATGKTVAITNSGNTSFSATPNESGSGASGPSDGPVSRSTIDTTSDEVASKRIKLDSNTIRDWETETDDSRPTVVELLQANLHQLDEIKRSVETHGQNIASLLSQLIHVISNGNKSSNSTNASATNRIDDAITATIREIGIPQDHV